MHHSARLIFLTISLLSVLRLNAQQSHCYSAEYLQQIQAQSPEIYNRIMEWRRNGEVAAHNSERTEEVYVVPVVFHIIYNTDVQNIDDTRIYEQINILNQDFQRMNDDAANTPGEFQPVAANCEIQFCLASFDPDGNSTTGIIRMHTDTTIWPLAYSEKVKYTDQGGDDAWPANSYLNIWVCNIQDGVLGYSSMPGGSPEADGIVIGWQFIGYSGVIGGQYNLGRTATHEIGHWLGLFHIWGDDANTCNQDDGIDDTPLQKGSTYGCPDFPLTDNCSPDPPGIMFMNYMDYSDDACMNIFTQGQADVMRNTLETVRGSILHSPAGCNEIEPLPGEIAEIIVYPNPSDGPFTIAINNFIGSGLTMQVRIYDMLGQLIAEQFPSPANYVSAYFDLSSVSKGCYVIQAFNGTYLLSKQIMVF